MATNLWLRGLGAGVALAMQLGCAHLAEANRLPGSAAATPTAEELDADCWRQFMDLRTPEISCAFPAVMEQVDRESIQKLTRQLFKDARCQITIRLERALVEAAVRSPEMTFVAPPQPVACVIVSSQGTLPVAFTFAPRIDIRGGTAVQATPGMGNVTGVNSWLAWPVVAYVNASGSIQDVMLRVVNAYLSRRRATLAQP